jgi:hypothetical protein
MSEAEVAFLYGTLRTAAAIGGYTLFLIVVAGATGGLLAFFSWKTPKKSI